MYRLTLRKPQTTKPGTAAPGTAEIQLGIVDRRFRDGKVFNPSSIVPVRRRHRDGRGETAPYTSLGPATSVTHKGERPMSITWRLDHAMPAELFEGMK
ncbi:MAG: hypothetical protein ACC742_16865, partial [Thermoanaerobaculales bacterium]